MRTRLLPVFQVSSIDLNLARDPINQIIFPSPVVMFHKQPVSLCYCCNRPLTEVAGLVGMRSFKVNNIFYRVMVYICERCDAFTYEPALVIMPDGYSAPKNAILSERHAIYTEGK